MSNNLNKELDEIFQHGHPLGDPLCEICLMWTKTKAYVNNAVVAARIDELSSVQLEYGGRFIATTYIDGDGQTIKGFLKAKDYAKTGWMGIGDESKTLKRKEFDRIERLRARALFIRKKLDGGWISANSKKHHLAELSALNWAIPILEDYIMHKTIASLPPDVREKFGFEKVYQDVSVPTP